MLGTLPETNISTWKDHIATLVHSYSCTKNNATDFSSYFLMCGQKLQLIVYQYFGNQTADLCAITSAKFVQQQRDRLKWAYKVAKQLNKKELKKHKLPYYCKYHCAKVGKGDVVLKKHSAFKGKHKFQDR